MYLPELVLRQVSPATQINMFGLCTTQIMNSSSCYSWSWQDNLICRKWKPGGKRKWRCLRDKEAVMAGSDRWMNGWSYRDACLKSVETLRIRLWNISQCLAAAGTCIHYRIFTVIALTYRLSHGRPTSTCMDNVVYVCPFSLCLFGYSIRIVCTM